MLSKRILIPQPAKRMPVSTGARSRLFGIVVLALLCAGLIPMHDCHARPPVPPANGRPRAASEPPRRPPPAAEARNRAAVLSHGQMSEGIRKIGPLGNPRPMPRASFASAAQAEPGSAKTSSPPQGAFVRAIRSFPPPGKALGTATKAASNRVDPRNPPLARGSEVSGPSTTSGSSTARSDTPPSEKSSTWKPKPPRSLDEALALADQAVKRPATGHIGNALQYAPGLPKVRTFAEWFSAGRNLYVNKNAIFNPQTDEERSKRMEFVGTNVAAGVITRMAVKVQDFGKDSSKKPYHASASWFGKGPVNFGTLWNGPVNLKSLFPGGKKMAFASAVFLGSKTVLQAHKLPQFMNQARQHVDAMRAGPPPPPPQPGFSPFE